MARGKMTFRCSACGYMAPKWLGRCPGCDAWSTLVEEDREELPKGSHANRTFRLPEGREGSSASRPLPLSEIQVGASERRPTGLKELDRVLGGGLVPGALILIGGDPGIGKSTLLLHGLDHLARAISGSPASRDGTVAVRDPSGGGASPRSVLYVTGEESPEQVRLRADRLGIDAERLLLLAETRADRIVKAIEDCRPIAVAIDSIQAVYDPELDSAPGSVSQIREVAARFLYLAKRIGVPTLLVGHVTKDGAIAGPRVLEHMVDTVLYFEGAGGHPYRILRAHKNRFGSTNEIGVFEMEGHGLREVQNPSELFLAERPEHAPGSVVLPALEGTRPVLVEVQALASPAGLGTPRRTCLGFDGARAALLVAVLERRAGLDLLSSDVFVNIAGGIEIEEPAADLAVAIALASSLRNRPVAPRTVVFGEIGLAGETRAVSQPDVRLFEARKLGFTRAILPSASLRKLRVPEGMEIVAAKALDEAVEAAIHLTGNS